MDNTIKQKTSKLGRLGIQLLAYTQLRKMKIIYSGEVSRALGISAKQESDLLSRLERGRMLIRLKRGAYLAPERMPPGGKWMASEYFILTGVMEVYKGTYQISGPTAFNFYGFEEQIPNRLCVYNNKIYGEKIIGGREFLFIKMTAERLGAVREITTKEGVSINMASKARALVDAVYDWSRYGTIPRAYSWIMESLRCDPEFSREIITVTAKYGNKATIRRIGYLLSSVGFSSGRLSKLKRSLGRSKSVIPWLPDQPAKGSVNTEWGIIANGVIPQ